MRENISKQPQNGSNDFQSRKQDIISFDDQKNQLLELPEEPLKISFGGIENLGQSAWTYAPRTLDPGQITHGFTKYLAEFLKLLDIDQYLDSRDMLSSLALFTSTRLV